MVPVGGAIVASHSVELIVAVAQIYPGTGQEAIYCTPSLGRYRGLDIPPPLWIRWLDIRPPPQVGIGWWRCCTPYPSIFIWGWGGRGGRGGGNVE